LFTSLAPARNNSCRNRGEVGSVIVGLVQAVSLEHRKPRLLVTSLDNSSDCICGSKKH
jgi:hypothetical protein